MSGKNFVGVVLTERQAKTLWALLLTHECSTVPGTARIAKAIRVKIGKSLKRTSGDKTP